MKPKLADTLAWQQAELLMQPALIRVIDNIRKALEPTQWQSHYEEIFTFPPGTSEETSSRVLLLQQQLAEASPQEADRIGQILDTLPQPFPDYQLHLDGYGRSHQVSLWELCYAVCFQNFAAAKLLSDGNPQGDIPVEIDTSLLDPTGEIDWQCLDNKAQAIVSQIFAQLRPVHSPDAENTVGEDCLPDQEASPESSPESAQEESG